MRNSDNETKTEIDSLSWVNIKKADKADTSSFVDEYNGFFVEEAPSLHLNRPKESASSKEPEPQTQSEIYIHPDVAPIMEKFKIADTQKSKLESAPVQTEHSSSSPSISIHDEMTATHIPQPKKPIQETKRSTGPKTLKKKNYTMHSKVEIDTGELVITNSRGDEIELQNPSDETIIDEIDYEKDQRNELRMFNNAAVLIYTRYGQLIGKGHLQNLSYSGLAVNSSCDLDLHEELRIEILGDKTIQPFHAKVVVTRVGCHNDSTVGLEFTEKSELANRILHQFILGEH